MEEPLVGTLCPVRILADQPRLMEVVETEVSAQFSETSEPVGGRPVYPAEVEGVDPGPAGVVSRSRAGLAPRRDTGVRGDQPDAAAGGVDVRGSAGVCKRFPHPGERQLSRAECVHRRPHSVPTVVEGVVRRGREQVEPERVELVEHERIGPH